ncbi:hypothetical protein ACQP2U_23970 [Nocardia sp. CA-084685]|uniref:hypothetical protein n=1 Tax=Nocardia sp. CA-084685 TaxID=3239970 RepID=UPI003D992748
MAKNNPVDQIGNQWAQLAEKAGSGEIRFDPKVAATVAAKIIAALEQVANVERQASADGFALQAGSFGMLPYEAGDRQSGDYQGGGPSPGEQTRQIYTTLASHTLKDGLLSHAKVLNEMLDTYLNIGKMYPSTDSTSAAIFDDAAKRQAALLNPSTTTAPAVAVTLDTNVPTESLTQDPPSGPKANSHDYADRMDHAQMVAATRPTYYGGKSDNKAVTPLDATQLSYHDLFYLGQTMDPQATSSTAGFWWQMAGQLYSRFADLKSVLGDQSVTQAWDGAGYSAAVKSMSTYGEQLDTLTGGMYGAHGMLMHVASWMNVVKPQLPQDPVPPEDQGVSGGELQALSYGDTRPYLDAYENGYAPNVVTDPSSYVPHIPPAAPVTYAAAKDSSPWGPPGQPVGGLNTSGPRIGALPGTGPSMTELQNSGLSDWNQIPLDPGDPYDRPSRETIYPGIDPNRMPPGGKPGDPNGSPYSTKPAGNPGGNPLSQAENALGQANSAAQRGPQPNSPTASGLANLANAHKAAVGKPKTGALGGGGGGGGAGIKAAELAKEAAQEAKLFPRAAAEAEKDVLAARAGMAPQGGYGGGYPGSGMGGAKPSGEEKEKKRAEYLSSKRYLAEAFGKPPAAAKPVVEQ